VAEEWIGLAAVLGPVLLIALFFVLRFKSRRDMQDTIRTALDKGQDLTPELIDRLGHPKDPKDKDLRLAVIWLALAIGLVLIGVAVPDPDAFRGTLAGAAFPFTIGIAYLLLHKFTDRD
jgi:hypothetical protein